MPASQARNRHRFRAFFQTMARSCQEISEAGRAAIFPPVTIAKAPTLMITSTPEERSPGYGILISTNREKPAGISNLTQKTLAQISLSKHRPGSSGASVDRNERSRISRSRKRRSPSHRCVRPATRPRHLHGKPQVLSAGRQDSISVLC